MYPGEEDMTVADKWSRAVLRKSTERVQIRVHGQVGGRTSYHNIFPHQTHECASSPPFSYV